MAKSGQTIKFDDALWKKKVRDLARRVKIEEEPFVREQAALLLQQIARYVAPFDRFPAWRQAKIATDLDLEAGIKSIYKDMNLNFSVKDIGFLQHIVDVTGTTRNVRRTLRTKRGRVYVVDVDYVNYSSWTEALRFHNSRKRADGHAPHRGKQGGNDANIGRWKDRNKMWVTQDIFDRVAAHLIAQLGISKAGVAKAMLDLNPKQRRNVPKWVSRHLGRARGKGAMIPKANNPTATFRASGVGINSVRQSSLEKLKVMRLQQMEKRLMFLLKKSAKKSGFKVR